MRAQSYLFAATLAAATVIPAPSWAAAQSPQIPGTGTVALPATVDQEYGFANKLIVKSRDGAVHVFHFTRDLLLHGGKGVEVDPLRDLREGTTVVVRDDANPGVAPAAQPGHTDQPLTEGMVSSIDRRQRVITVRFENARLATFRLSNVAAAEAQKSSVPDDAGVVIVSYIDDLGRPVEHSFKRLP